MNCKICNEETDAQIEVNSTDVPICDKCGGSLFLNMAKAYVSNKTIWDIGNRKERKPVEKHPEISADVLNYLYKNLLKRKRPEYKADDIPDSYLNDISNRVNDGHTKEELLAVCYFKYKEWVGDPKMAKYIQASTLFKKSNFGKYLAEVAHKIPNNIRINNTDQRAIIKELNSYGIRGEVNETTDKLAKELMASGYENKLFLNLYLKEKI
jgi:uncharacterized phage protein (TIGR02220 family)